MRPNKRDQLVRKALDAFDRHGYHATGMDRLVAETGVSKTAMYKHFRSKDDLILAVLRLRDEQLRGWLEKRLAATGGSPAARLLDLFAALGDWFEEPGFHGCMFIKASGEFQDPEDPIHALAAEHKRLLRRTFAGLARDAGAADPEALARQLLLLVDGATVSAALGHGDDPAGDARDAARAILEAAGIGVDS